MSLRIASGLDGNKMMRECLTATTASMGLASLRCGRGRSRHAIHNSTVLASSSLLTASSRLSGIADG